jgi:hypothetical protein
MGEAGPDILLGQFTEIIEDLLMGLARGEPAEHIRHRYPHIPDARTAASLTRIN